MVVSVIAVGSPLGEVEHDDFSAMAESRLPYLVDNTAALFHRGMFLFLYVGASRPPGKLLLEECT
jgi:hypothetical protein